MQSCAPILRLTECGREAGEAIFYTDSEEVGGACVGGRSMSMAQKLAALTPLNTQTCTHAADTHQHEATESFNYGTFDCDGYA